MNNLDLFVGGGGGRDGSRSPVRRRARMRNFLEISYLRHELKTLSVFNYRSFIGLRIFPQTEIFRGFSLCTTYHISSREAMEGGGAMA